MSLCINPACPQPNPPDNSTSRHCHSCGAPLLLQDRYRVMRLISSQSGFGQVYAAYERTVPKILKVLKPDFNHNAKVLELFQREARVLSELHHPGLPQVDADGYFPFYPQAEDEPLHCLIMEHIDGPNLRQWMQQQGNHPISEQQAVLWLAQITDVLHRVHGQQYFHRDIKPENIMLRSTGQLVLVDFGAARAITSSPSQLGASAITAISSAGYTPPEQEQGQAVPQSDFFALGRTLVYLLTARPPNDPAIYDPRTNRFHWRPFAPGLSPTLADLIDDLTAPRALDRPANTQAILDRLAVVRAAQPTFPPGVRAEAWPETALDPTGSPTPPQTAPPTPPPPTTLTQRILPRRLWGAVATGLVLVVGGGLASVALYRRTGEGTVPTAPAAIASTVTPLESLPGHQGDIRDLLLLKDGTTAITAGDDEVIRLWDLTTGAEIARLPGHQGTVNALALTLDEQLLISASTDRTIRFWDLDQRQEVSRIDNAHATPINAVVVSPVGQIFASASAGGDIKLWDLQTLAEVGTLDGQAGLINHLVFTRDGQYLASGGLALRLWDVNSQQERLALAGHDSFINRLEVTADGRRLITASADHTIRIWDLATGDLQMELDQHTNFVNDLWVDGARLWSASADQSVRVWDTASGMPLEHISGFETDIYRFVVQPSGRLVTIGGQRNNVYIWLPDL